MPGTHSRPTLSVNPPKAHLPGTGASCPQHGEGGCPFEPGRVRGTHSSAGGVGVPVPWSDDARMVLLQRGICASTGGRLYPLVLSAYPLGRRNSQRRKRMTYTMAATAAHLDSGPVVMNAATRHTTGNSIRRASRNWSFQLKDGPGARWSLVRVTQRGFHIVGRLRRR